MTRIIALSGGRDAVGKTSAAVELATHLAAAGQRVCLLELVTDTRAASNWLDAAPAATLSDRVTGRNAGERLPASLPQGFDLVVAGGGRHWLRELSAEQLASVSDALAQLQGYDFMLIDVGIETDQNQLAFSLASPELLVVITPEPESRSDAYTVLKLLYAEQYAGTISVLVNKSPNATAGGHAYDKLREIASFYLDMDPPLAALIGMAESRAVADGGAAATPRLPAADVEKLAQHILAQNAAALQRDMASFCSQLLQAAGAVAAVDGDVDVEAEFKPALVASQPQFDLREQLAQLSTQVDALINEVEHWREQQTAHPPAASAPPAPAAPARERCSVAAIAAMAGRSERVSVAGETFAIYHLRTASGRQQRFACQSSDDDLEEPEPQTRSS